MSACEFVEFEEVDELGRRRLRCSVCGFTTAPIRGKKVRIIGPPCPGADQATAGIPQWGVGTELARILKEWGFKSAAGCGCKSMERKMNAWGVAGCREHRAEIIAHLEKQLAKNILAQTAAGVAYCLGVDPADWLVGKAIDAADRESAQ